MLKLWLCPNAAAPWQPLQGKMLSPTSPVRGAGGSKLSSSQTAPPVCCVVSTYPQQRLVSARPCRHCHTATAGQPPTCCPVSTDHSRWGLPLHLSQSSQPCVQVRTSRELQPSAAQPRPRPMKNPSRQVAKDSRLTLQTYWLRAPGEKVWERTMVLLRVKGEPRALRPGLSFGRLATSSGKRSSVLVSLST